MKHIAEQTKEKLSIELLKDGVSDDKIVGYIKYHNVKEIEKVRNELNGTE